MTNRVILRVAPALLLAAAACSSATPEPVATAPQPAADTSTRVATAAPAPRDTAPARDPARDRRDSVRAQVLRDSAVAAAPTPSGLPPVEDSLLTALVHFGFDSAELNDSARAVLTEKVGVLRRNDRLRVQVAGHADERGADEYNLALGLRRAAAVKQFLTAYGIAGDRISIVSYGEERPLDSAADEAAWARNRRAETAPRRP
jgi:peptidoglycan-associated lipoprotein